ncbi:DUF3040 domain-containing protein [Ruicaihuangia caeni]|uniref:DUF3040 domain-containing protein n=1 Tax=Ruicaihuangia caeni TaxID=3042517 RepID=UPI0033902694
MPLSEQEQRLLEEMERSLYQHDADFVATVGSHRGKPNYTIIVVGALMVLAGIGVLVAGVALSQPIVGVLGFILMFAGVLLIVAPPRKLQRKPSSGFNASKPGGSGKSGSSSFMDNLNDRWDRRADGR